MKTVKYVCNRCGYAPEPTARESFVTQVWVTLVALLATFGVLFIVYLAIVGVSIPISNVLTANFAGQGMGDREQLRSIALNMTTECSGDVSACFAAELYRNLSGIRYVPVGKGHIGLYDPLRVLEDGGDCKNTANLYVRLVQSLGFEAYMSCNVKHKHCVSVVPDYWHGKRQDGYVFVDLTIPMIMHVDKEEDVWGWYDNREASEESNVSVM